ncbi:hypothetical protein SAMD00019534_007910 [Acytostelium subglobosum LB1]|uniref:hypothetical protein n=1 Tax=Acytostelium subglobosum LB1 TaxID=1410327 RepID=UPI0006448241|nr:hypothetical protein SAMD00019534_007910 [Acytostelium subglobosum LB1]GAM17616.1 hypothetical protein SAMD00019534_007910 [Acytostelium subglobosum LB1]|eukprot:XP_012758212.1 hypothetical protein SAMD00019534_007910 [Acytostelium subglobosum LB1]
MIKSSLILLVVFSIVIVRSQEALSGCGVGSAIYNDAYANWSDGQGACTLPTPSEIGVAGLNKFYMNAQSGSGMCGTCFNLTGPSGSTLVKVVDSCNSVALCTQTTHAHFIISPKDFQKINGASLSTMYNVGYQMVACPLFDDFKVTMIPADTGSYQYYFSAGLSGYSLPIKSVEVTVAGVYTKMKYQGGLWVWNKAATAFSFPSKMRITSQTNEQAIVSLDDPPTAPLVVPAFVQDALEAPCGAPAASPAIYDNALAQGWFDASWHSSEKTYTDTSVTTGTNIAIGLEPLGGLKMSSLNPVPTGNIIALQFDAMSNVSNAVFALSLNSDKNLSIAIDTKFETYNVSMVELGAHATESAVVFQNIQGTGVMLKVANVHWVFDDTVGEPPKGIVTLPPLPSPNEGGPRPHSPSTGTSTGASVTSGGTTDGSDDLSSPSRGGSKIPPPRTQVGAHDDSTSSNHSSGWRTSVVPGFYAVILLLSAVLLL